MTRFSTRLTAVWTTAWRTVERFNGTDGWAIASHVALSTLMALFPFLIFLTAVAAFFDLRNLSETVVNLIFASVPNAIAGPIAGEVRNVLLVQRRDLLTIGAALALWFASSGVEALRVGLNRAYGRSETRNILLLRLQSLVFVLIGTMVLLALALLVVLAPALWTVLVRFLPSTRDFTHLITITRFALALAIAGLGLVAAHLWLPAGRRRLGEVAPGIALTLVAWLAGGGAFSFYLADFANYASTYAGLAGVMTAIVFLYLLAAIVLVGAALNATLIGARGVAPAAMPGRDGDQH